MAITREKILQSRLYKVVLWVIALSMAGGSLLFSPLFFRRSGPVRQALLTVNGYSVSAEQFQQRLSRELEMIASLRQMYGPQIDAQLKMLGLDNPKERVTQALIQETLLNQVADTIRLDLTSAFISQKLSDPTILLQELRSIIPLHVIDQNGAIDFGALQIFLQQHGLTFADFERAAERVLRQKFITDLVALGTYVTPQEIKNYFIQNFLAHKYSILVLPFEKFVERVQKEPVSDEALEKFFKAENAKSKRFWIPEKRIATKFLFKPELYSVEITPKNIENYYKKHRQKLFLEAPAQVKVRRILFKITDMDQEKAQAVYQKAQNIHAQLKNDPSLFESLAKEHSQDEQTAAKGGDIGFIKRGDKDKAFERAAFRLKTDGEISDIIQTNEGLEIIQRITYKPAVYKPLDTVQQEIKKALLKDLFKAKFMEETRELIDVQEGMNAVTMFADKKGVKPTTIEIDKTTSVKGKLEEKLFKTKKGRITRFVNEQGEGIILFVNEIKKSHEPSFQKVKEEVKKAWLQNRAFEMLQDALQKAQKPNARLDQLKNEYYGYIITTDWLKRDDQKSFESLKNKDIPVEQLLFFQHKPGAITVALDDHGGYIAQLNDIETFNDTLFRQRYSEIVKDLYTNKKELVIRAFIASLYRNATIQTKEDVDTEEQVPLEDTVDF